MQMVSCNEEISIDGWVVRIRKPSGSGPFPVLLMLHGWTGDENSMWVFAPRLPANALLVAPQGLYAASLDGYGWHAAHTKPWPWVDDFIPAVNRIFEIFTETYLPDGDFSQLHLIGFSQGAALAYTMTLLYPERVTSLAGLSGFLPDGASSWLRPERLKGLPVFLAHGTVDNLVPVERARKSAEMLESVGAQVSYCEEDVGHKLSAKCFHSLEAFYKRLFTQTG